MAEGVCENIDNSSVGATENQAPVLASSQIISEPPEEKNDDPPMEQEVEIHQQTPSFVVQPKNVPGGSTVNGRTNSLPNEKAGLGHGNRDGSDMNNLPGSGVERQQMEQRGSRGRVADCPPGQGDTDHSTSIIPPGQEPGPSTSMQNQPHQCTKIRSAPPNRKQRLNEHELEMRGAVGGHTDQPAPGPSSVVAETGPGTSMQNQSHLRTNIRSAPPKRKQRLNERELQMRGAVGGHTDQPAPGPSSAVAAEEQQPATRNASRSMFTNGKGDSIRRHRAPTKSSRKRGKKKKNRKCNKDDARRQQKQQVIPCPNNQPAATVPQREPPTERQEATVESVPETVAAQSSLDNDSSHRVESNSCSDGGPRNLAVGLEMPRILDHNPTSREPNGAERVWIVLLNDRPIAPWMWFSQQQQRVDLNGVGQEAEAEEIDLRPGAPREVYVRRNDELCRAF